MTAMRNGKAHNSIADKRRRGPRGFSLIEVLAALMLVAIVLPVAMRGLSMASRQASVAARRSQATMLAERQLNEILAHHTGQTIERIQEDSERDRYFSAEEAKAYGLVDDVLGADPNKKSP